MARPAGAGRRLSKVIEQDVLVEDFSLDGIEMEVDDDGDYAAAGVRIFCSERPTQKPCHLRSSTSVTILIKQAKV